MDARNGPKIKPVRRIVDSSVFVDDWELRLVRRGIKTDSYADKIFGR